MHGVLETYSSLNPEKKNRSLFLTQPEMYSVQPVTKICFSLTNWFYLLTNLVDVIFSIKISKVGGWNLFKLKHL